MPYLPKELVKLFGFASWLRLTVENDLGKCLAGGDMLTVSRADCDPVGDPVSFTEDSSPTFCISIRIGEVLDEGRCVFDGDVPARLHNVASEKTIQDSVVVRNEREGVSAKGQCDSQSDGAIRVQESRGRNVEK